MEKYHVIEYPDSVSTNILKEYIPTFCCKNISIEL